MLPGPRGTLRHYIPGPAGHFEKPVGPLRARVAIAAVHVVADRPADRMHGETAIDWELTLSFRHHVWEWGLGVAEAMDTAQRGMGLGWKGASHLITRTAREARAVKGLVVCGASTDQLAPGTARTLEDVVHAYEEQCDLVEAAGSRVVLMASRELARLARSADDYLNVYSTLLDQLREPIIHWLGPMFDPALAGYWGTVDPLEAVEHCLALIKANRDKVDGVKLSMLDESLEVDLRRRLPNGVRLYTGDDLNFVSLIEGDGHGHSDALLGIFDAIAPAASMALQCLDRGDLDGYRGLLGKTVDLSWLLFTAPTPNYKTGLVFLAYLNGHQASFPNARWAGEPSITDSACRGLRGGRSGRSPCRSRDRDDQDEPISCVGRLQSMRRAARATKRNSRMSDRYVHGYHPLERERLQDQAGTPGDLLHSDTTYPGGSKG